VRESKASNTQELAMLTEQIVTWTSKKIRRKSREMSILPAQQP